MGLRNAYCGMTLVLSGLILCQTCCTAAQEGHELAQYQSCVEQLQEAQRQLAGEKYERAAELAWQSAEMLLKLAESPDAAKELALANAFQPAGEILYRAGRSKQSVRCFDKVVELQPRSAPHNWQRGIALCSVGDFQRGAEQFKTHHDVNPDDVENSAWYFLCIAKTEGIDAARKTVIPSRGDGREPMMSILGMLKGDLKPEDVIQAAIRNTADGPSRKRAQFYADLYVGLYFDSLDRPAEAAKYLKRSLTYQHYGYMVDVARVYLHDRFSQEAAREGGGKKTHGDVRQPAQPKSDAAGDVPESNSLDDSSLDDLKSEPDSH